MRNIHCLFRASAFISGLCPSCPYTGMRQFLSASDHVFNAIKVADFKTSCSSYDKARMCFVFVFRYQAIIRTVKEI